MLTVDHRRLTADRRQEMEQQSVVGGPWSVTRPSLEYQHAFDLCAIEVHRAGGPVAVFASSPFYARELLKRLGKRPLILYPLGGWDDEFEGDWEALSPEVTWEGIVVTRPGGKGVPLPVVATLWAEPEKGGGEATLGYIRQTLQPARRLWVITSGRLSRLIPEWRRAEDQPVRDPAGLQQALRWLRQNGFTLQALYGFHGWVSIFWGLLAKRWGQLGRGDLADRCYFQMRETFVVTGWQARWAVLSLIVAQRGSKAG